MWRQVAFWTFVVLVCVVAAALVGRSQARDAARRAWTTVDPATRCACLRPGPDLVSDRGAPPYLCGVCLGWF